MIFDAPLRAGAVFFTQADAGEIFLRTTDAADFGFLMLFCAVAIAGERSINVKKSQAVLNKIDGTKADVNRLAVDKYPNS